MLPILSVNMEKTDAHKFERLYERYKYILFHQILSVVHNEKDAEDLLQETFIKIAKNLKNIDCSNEKQTLSFLIVIAKNTAFDHIRKESKTPNVPLEDDEDRATYEDVLSTVIHKLKYQDIVSSITDIPHPYGEVLYLHYVKDFSVKETAALLDRKNSTVKMQLVRGKKLLIEKLKGALYE